MGGEKESISMATCTVLVNTHTHTQVMERKGDAEEAIEKLNGVEMYERAVTLDWAKSKNPKPSSGRGEFFLSRFSFPSILLSVV